MVRGNGFTLVEVLVAMAITAVVATLSYSTLSSVMIGVEATRSESTRLQELSRAMTVMARDVRLFVNRSIRDEFGGEGPALEGGVLAREMLALTRAGWHNSADLPRSTLQRVAYYLDEDKLVRASFPILDRFGAVEPIETVLLENVEEFDVRFLATVRDLRVGRGIEIDTRYWEENWVADLSNPEANRTPPAALEVRIRLEDGGDIERLFVVAPDAQ